MDEDCRDDECPITPAEYSWVKDDYPTTVAFSRAKVWNADKILTCLGNGALRKPHQGNVPPTTILKVIGVALISRELSDKLRKLLRG